MLSELFRAFFLVLVAEMGDKSQILSMTFATKYKMKEVLLGVIVGVAFNHGIAIVFGRLFSKIIPMSYIQIAAGTLFILFAYLSLREEDEELDEEGREFSPVITVALAFFIGELGDKTQLTAMTLAAEASFPLIILLGTTLGMLATSALGIIIGGKLGKKIPDLLINIISSLVFFVFGSIKLAEQLGLNRIIIILSLLIIIEIYLISKKLRERKKAGLSAMQIAAQKLYEQTRPIKDTIDEICLGEALCGSCDGKDCFLGYIRSLIDQSRKQGNYNVEMDYREIDQRIRKEFDREKLLKSLIIIKKESEDNKWPKDENFVINRVANYIEDFLFEEHITFDLTFDKYIEVLEVKTREVGLSLRDL